MRPDPMTEWIGLEFRHLAALRAIADEGSFKGAARLLGYTPSAISQQIASLERIVGTEVVAREQGRKALGPTEAGRILLSHLDAIVARLHAAKVDVEKLERGTAGHMRIGAYESVGVRILPEVMRRFLESHPKMRIEVVDASIDLDLLRSLERGVLDLAFTTPPIPAGPFESRTVLYDPWVLVAQKGSEHVDCGAPRSPNELAGPRSHSAVSTPSRPYPDPERRADSRSVSLMTFEIIQRQLKSVGIEFTPRFIAPAVLFGGGMLTGGDWQAALFTFLGSPTSGPTFFGIGGCGGDQNYANFCNPKASALLKKAQFTPDEAERNSMLAQAETYLAEEVFSIPLFARPTFVINNNKVKGLVRNPTNQSTTWNAEVWRVS
jgi:DNA-binding transcriptional LysR family regulator